MAAIMSKITNVAIYLRKSRGDETQDVLKKHRLDLIAYAQQHMWNFKLYEENPLSGETMATRPVFFGLLCEIEQGKYDAVLAIHWDRISRGDTGEFSIIAGAFQYSNTYIITPERVYDLNDIADRAMLGIQSVMANTELNMIKKRLYDGKVRGYKRGNLSNGNPPYPYLKKKTVGQDEENRVKIIFNIEVDAEKALIYNRIKQMYLAGQNLQKIASQLNKEGIPSPNGKYWHNNTVKRLLINEFHMGFVIFKKTQTKKAPLSGKKEVVERDISEWIITEGKHKQLALKTPEEHEKIMKMFEKNKKIAPRSKEGAFPTSGLLYCKKCGHTMQYSLGRYEAIANKRYYHTRCNHRMTDGSKCPQVGVKMDDRFYNALYNTIIHKYIDADKINRILQSNTEKQERDKLLAVKEKALQTEEKALSFARSEYELGHYTIDDLEDAKQRREPVIKKLKKEIHELKSKTFSSITKKEVEQKLKNFKNTWKASSDQTKNEILKTMLKKIWYDREGDDVIFEIEY